MLIAVLKAVKMVLSCCPKNSQDAAVVAALKAVQDAEKKHPAHKDQVQRLIPISKHGLSVPYRPGFDPRLLRTSFREAAEWSYEVQMWDYEVQMY
jgi:hypothetical protein